MKRRKSFSGEDSRRAILRYKGDKCVACGVKVKEKIDRYFSSIVAFDLNHVNPSKKAKNYKSLMNSSLSQKMLDESDKCVLLCKDCHVALHAQNGQGTLTVHSRWNNLQKSRKINCQFLMMRDQNTAKPKLYFFCDQNVFDTFFDVFLGGEFLGRTTSNSLEQGKLAMLLGFIGPRKSLKIRNTSRMLVFKGFFRKDNFVQIKFHSDFSFLKGSCRSLNGSPNFFQNGKFISTPNKVTDNFTIRFLVKAEELTRLNLDVELSILESDNCWILDQHED